MPDEDILIVGEIIHLPCLVTNEDGLAGIQYGYPATVDSHVALDMQLLERDENTNAHMLRKSLTEEWQKQQDAKQPYHPLRLPGITILIEIWETGHLKNF